MKKILKFLLIIAIFMPFMANAECTSSTPRDNCVCPGWGYSSASTTGDECRQCKELYYNLGGSGRTTCSECATESNGQYTLNTSAVNIQNAVYDTTFAQQTGLSYCPWVCETGYFKNDENSCAQCPSTESFSSITVADEYMSNLVACCLNDNYLIKNDSGQYKCGQCGQNQAKMPVAGTSNVYTCTQCGNYAFVRDNECVCKGNTYGDGTTCKKCPAGMLTVVPGYTGVSGETLEAAYERVRHNPNFQGEPGATEKSQCKIGAFTKFCNGNGTHCMRLMQ